MTMIWNPESTTLKEKEDSRKMIDKKAFKWVRSEGKEEGLEKLTAGHFFAPRLSCIIPEKERSLLVTFAGEK